MDHASVKAKLERMANELFDESKLFESIGRDVDGDLVLEHTWYGTYKIYMVVSEIPQFEVKGKPWAELDLPTFRVVIYTRVFPRLKRGATLNKFVTELARSHVFSTAYLNSEDDGTDSLWIRTALVADTLDTHELRNAAIQLVADLQEVKEIVPPKIHAF